MRKLKLSALALGAALALGVGAVGVLGAKEALGVSADSTTITAGQFTAVDTKDIDQTVNGIRFTINASTITADQVRVYKGKTLTIYAPANYELTSVEMTCTAKGTAKYGPGCFTAIDGYTFEASGFLGTWTGTADSIALTASANQVRITQFVIEYSSKQTDEPAIALSKSSLTFIENDAASEITVTPNAAFTADPTLSLGSVPNYVNVAITGLTLSVSPKAVGEEDITINAVHGSEQASATLSVKVLSKHGRVANDPFTVAEAREGIDGGLSTSEFFYVEGIVSEVVEYKSDYKSITYNISADGTTTTDQLQVYSGKGLNGADFSSKSDVEVGAEVVVYGKLKKHYETYEFDYNNYLVSYTVPSKTLTGIEVADPKTAFEVGDTWEFGGTVTASYDNGSSTNVTDQATFTGYNMSAAGQQTVTVSYSEGEVTKETTYTITVSEPVVKYTVSFNANGGTGEMTPVQVEEDQDYELPECTFTAPEGKRFAGWSLDGSTVVTQVYVGSDVTVYALWEDTPTVSYKKVKTDLANYSGDYMIVYETGGLAFDGSLSTLDASKNTVAVSIEDEVISMEETSEFTIAAKEGGYSIRSASKLYIGNSSDTNTIKTSESDVYDNSVSVNTDAEADIISAGTHLRYNANSGQERFRYFKAATYTSQKAIALYMQVDEAEALALDILNETEATCSGYVDGTTTHEAADFETAWALLSSKFDALGADAKAKLAEAEADKDGKMLAEAMARYELLVRKYGLDPFIDGRAVAPALAYNQNTAETTSVMIVVVAAVALVSIASVVTVVVIKRRRMSR